MSIKIRLNRILWQFTGGQKVVEVTGHTTGECLEDLERRFPAIKEGIRDKQGQIRSYYQIYVNSDITYPEELTKPVKEGDEISITSLVGGG